MLKDGVRSSRCTTIGERAYTPNIKTLASTAQTALDSTRVTPASNPSPLFFAKDETKAIADTHKSMVTAWADKRLIVLIDALDEAQRNSPRAF